MKIPLRFQITEFDCGTLALQNAVSYLFERETIPAEVIRAISKYTLDCYDEDGNIGQGGTSKEAIEKMTKWFCNYVKNHNFKINVKHMLGSDVNLREIDNCIKHGGCVLLRTYQTDEHYVLITNITDNFVYLWDSYYLNENYYDSDSDVKIILNKPFHYNRIISKSRLLSNTKDDFALGPVDNRECVLFNKCNLSQMNKDKNDNL